MQGRVNQLNGRSDSGKDRSGDGCRRNPIEPIKRNRFRVLVLIVCCLKNNAIATSSGSD